MVDMEYDSVCCESQYYFFTKIKDTNYFETNSIVIVNDYSLFCVKKNAVNFLTAFPCISCILLTK